MSTQETTKIVASQRKRVESPRIQPLVLTETAREHNSALRSGPTTVPARSTFVTPKANVETTASSTLSMSAGTINVTVPTPLRFMKDSLFRIRRFANDTSIDQVHGALKNLLLHIRQLVNDVDKESGTSWAQGVYNGLRHASKKKDPNIVPGAGFLHDFVSKSRNAIVSGKGARLLKGKFSDARNVLSTGKVRCVVQDFVRNAQHFLTSKDGQGARLAKAAVDSARVALAENEAEVVVL
jgi:hypothetical protein